MDDPIQWKVTVTDSTGSPDLDMGMTVVDALNGFEGSTLHVAMDESWLLETTRPSSSARELPTTPKQAEADQVEKDDTLKASTSAPTLPLDEKTRDQDPFPAVPTAHSHRLSGLFQGWLESNKNPAPPPSPQLSMVNGMAGTRPTLENITSPISGSGSGAVPLLGTPGRSFDDKMESGVEIDEEEWERFLVRRTCTVKELTDTAKDDLNLQGDKRQAMYSLTPSRKAYLLAQNKASTTISSPSPPPQPTFPRPASANTPYISLSAGTSAIGFGRLLPQITGASSTSASSSSPRAAKTEGWGKRLSLASLGSWTGVSVSTDGGLRPDAGEGDDDEDGGITPKADMYTLSEKGLGETKVLEEQVTGGLWGWWTGAGKPEEGSPAAFISKLSDR